MTQGRISWRQKIEVRYEDAKVVVECASVFEVRDDGNVPYSLGNAHLFSLPSGGTDVVVEERAKRRGEPSTSVEVSLLNDKIQNERLYRDGDILRFFPRTKSFDDLESFHVVLRYDLPWTRPLSERFAVDLDIVFLVKEYLSSIGAADSEILSFLEVLITPPPGCQWDKESDLDDAIHRGVGRLKCMEMNGTTGLHINKSIDLSFRSQNSTRGAGKGRLVLRLPIYQDSVEQTRYAETLAGRISAAPAEDVIVFVCDLRGSSDETIDGRPSLDILKYHGYWRRDVAKPFRLLKIVGDLVLAVCSPSTFLQDCLPEILRSYEKSLGLGVPIRGGLHIGKASPSGSRTDTMAGSAIGVDFLGDAINYGAKIGDYKQNESGIVASQAFVDWFRAKTGASPKAVYWRDIDIGSAARIKLFRVDLAQLTRTGVRVGDSIGLVPTFPDRLIERAKKIRSRLIVGLDPDVHRFPTALKERWMKSPTVDTLQDIIFEFNRSIVEATEAVAVAFKPQIAFYEQYGEAGLRALGRTLKLLREKGQIAILDAKRNDIEHTAKAYADAWLADYSPFTERLNEWRFDAITLNPYLGTEGVAPFLEANSRAGVFLLAKTSNPSSADIQDLKLENGTAVYEEVSRLADKWGQADGVGSSKYSRVGLVVGATHPEAALRIREIASSALFLMPGVGAQGAPLQSIKGAGGKDGFGAYASSSRTVLYSFAEDTSGSNSRAWDVVVGTSAAAKAKELKDAINREFGQK